MSELLVVERVLATSSTGTIFSARGISGALLRVRSAMPVLVGVGEAYAVVGSETRYRDKSGRSWRQLEATSIQRERVTGRLLGAWLEQLPHLGPVRAKRLLDTFGDQVLDVLSDASNLDLIAEAIDPRRPALALRIAAAVLLATCAKSSQESALVAEARFLKFLEDNGVDDRRAARQLWRLLGSNAADERLVSNPYLAASVMGWKQADHLGIRLLATRQDVSDPAHHIDRQHGAIDNIWRGLLATGDTSISGLELQRQLSRRGVDADEALMAIYGAIPPSSPEHFVRAPGAAWIEDDLASRISAMSCAPSKAKSWSPDDLISLVTNAEDVVGFRLTAEQRNAVLSLLCRPFGVLQGGAGVGKTAVTKVLCEAWEMLGGTCVLTALSGKAALQLSRGASSISRPRIAFTAARLLRTLFARREMQKEGREAPPDWPSIDSKTLVIVDESSMVDTPTLRQLSEHLKPGTHLLLVGDHGQLPSVGFGRVFHDLVEDGRHVISMNRVMRQAEDSPIPTAATCIREGRVPELDVFSGQESGIYLLPTSKKERLSAWKAVYEELRGRWHTGEVMAVAGLNASVDWLNLEASASYRRAKGQPALLRLGPFATVAVGEPVICRQNRYSDGLFNGLLGSVASTADDRLSVHWEGEPEARPLSAEAAADISLGYAITCHKSQGSSAQAVVVLLEDTRLVTREWLYTAVTRARRLVVLVGERDVLQSAVERRTHRTTGFRLPH